MSDSDDSYDEHLRSALLASSQQFDRAILGLSSGTLALSLAFIKDVGPAVSADCLVTLICSWVVFSGAIASTVSSFLTSQRATRAYLEHKEAAGDTWAGITSGLNWLSGLLFVAGFVLTVVFVSNNIK